MELTKFTHACVRVERDGAVLVIDPGSFSEVAEALQGAHAVLVTHEHADHIAVEEVSAKLQSSPGLELHAPEVVAASLRERLGGHEAAGRVHAVEPGARFRAAGFGITAFGGQHALIHPKIPMVANIGYLIDGGLYHPGDSFTVPRGVEVTTLLVPVHAPWSKTAEVIDFVAAVRAPVAYPIHDALLNEAGLDLVDGHIARLGGPYGTSYRRLVPGESVTVPGP
jgi:L-ascorbate metabolism protein UlaG (beta-lactamase superfamily)